MCKQVITIKVDSAVSGQRDENGEGAGEWLLILTWRIRENFTTWMSFKLCLEGEPNFNK